MYIGHLDLRGTETFIGVWTVNMIRQPKSQSHVPEIQWDSLQFVERLPSDPSVLNLLSGIDGLQRLMFDNVQSTVDKVCYLLRTGGFDPTTKIAEFLQKRHDTLKPPLDGEDVVSQMN